MTSVADYKLTNGEEALKRSLRAATFLAGRYNPVGKYIRAWNDDVGLNPEDSKAGYAIIDCMINIPLLYWAWQQTGDPRYRQVADFHA